LTEGEEKIYRQGAKDAKTDAKESIDRFLIFDPVTQNRAVLQTNSNSEILGVCLGVLGGLAVMIFSLDNRPCVSLH
jgi:hypothetical protein